jgi:hypothetical protein
MLHMGQENHERFRAYRQPPVRPARRAPRPAQALVRSSLD